MKPKPKLVRKTLFHKFVHTNNFQCRNSNKEQEVAPGSWSSLLQNMGKKPSHLFTHYHYSISPTVIQIMNLASTQFLWKISNIPHRCPKLKSKTRHWVCQIPSTAASKILHFSVSKINLQPKIQETEISPPTKQNLSLWKFYCKINSSHRRKTKWFFPWQIHSVSSLF